MFQLELRLEVRKLCINWFSVAVTKIPYAWYVGKVGSLFSSWFWKLRVQDPGDPTVKAILSTSMEMVEELTDHMIREGRHPGSHKLTSLR